MGFNKLFVFILAFGFLGYESKASDCLDPIRALLADSTGNSTGSDVEERPRELVYRISRSPAESFRIQTGMRIRALGRNPTILGALDEPFDSAWIVVYRDGAFATSLASEMARLNYSDGTIGIYDLARMPSGERISSYLLSTYLIQMVPFGPLSDAPRIVRMSGDVMANGTMLVKSLMPYARVSSYNAVDANENP